MCDEISEITKNETCYENGVRTYYCACSGCTYSRTEAIDSQGHQLEGDVCKRCFRLLCFERSWDKMYSLVDTSSLLCSCSCFFKEVAKIYEPVSSVFIETCLLLLFLVVIAEASCLNDDFLFILLLRILVVCLEAL